MFGGNTKLYRVFETAMLALLVIALVCCGKGGSVATHTQLDGPESRAQTAGSDSIQTPADGFDVSELPERYQELFNQPVWNAYIPAPDDNYINAPPDPATAVPYEPQVQYSGDNGNAQERNASYTAPHDEPIAAKGELTQNEAELMVLKNIGYAGDPDLDGFDNPIKAYSGKTPSAFWTYVHVGVASPTIEQWGTSKEYALFQLYKPDVYNFAELCYGDLSDDPTGRTAYKISGHSYYRFNQPTGLAGEGETDCAWRDLFAYPVTDEIEIVNEGWIYEGSDGKCATAGTIQYFRGEIENGAAGIDYPWSMLVQITQTDYCDIQEDILDPSKNALLGIGLEGLTESEIMELKARASIPVFGAIASLYRDLNPANPDNPCDGILGFPLEPMKDYNGGRTMVNAINGEYRLFGQKFFHGFIWWYDFVDPNVNDWVFPYIYDGTSVYSDDGELKPLFERHIEYGLAGPIGCIGWTDRYDVEQGQLVTFNAITWGGYESSAGTGLYNDILWNFGDGTVGVGRTAGKRYTELGRYRVRLIVINDDDAIIPITGANDPNVAVYNMKRIHCGITGEAMPGRMNLLVIDEDQDTPFQYDDSWAYQQTLDELGIDYDVMTGDVSLDDMLWYWAVLYANSMSTSSNFNNTDCDDFDVYDAQRFADYVVDNAGNFFWCNGLMTYFPYLGFNMSGISDVGFCRMLGCAGSGTPPWSGWGGLGAHSLHTIQGSLSSSCHSISQVQLNRSYGWYSAIAGPCYYWAQYKGKMDTGGEVIDVGPYPSGCISGMMKDNNGADEDGGIAIFLGFAFYAVNQTSPDPGGRLTLMENVLGYFFNWGHYGGGGLIPEYLPYDEEFDLLYVTAHAYHEDGTVDGGDGSLGRAGYDQYADGTGTVYHNFGAVPPDAGDVHLRIVAREADEYNDHYNWRFVVDWRDGKRSLVLGESEMDTYSLTHTYTSAIEPGVNAYTIDGYSGNDATAIYDGSGGTGADAGLYPDLGEDAGDTGPGAPTAIVVHAWNGLGEETGWGINAFIGGVLVGIGE